MLMRLFAPQFLVVWAFIGSAVAVHFRGKVRLGFWRQVSDHSTIMAPYNVLMYLFSAVPNRPILQQGLLLELAVLRDNWQVIREEALELFARGRIKAADEYNDWGFNSFFRTGWKRFYLKWYDQALPSAVANCPKTVELVNAIPTVKGAMFASLPPGGRLVQHRDPYAGSLRYHLGLQVPQSPGECRIFIAALLVARGRGPCIRRDLSALCRKHHQRRPHYPVLRCRTAAAHAGDDRGQPLGQPPRH
jgi:beta-hydroxylase